MRAGATIRINRLREGFRFKSTGADDPFPPTDDPFPPTDGPCTPTGGPFSPTGDPFPTTVGPFPPTGGPFPPAVGPFPPAVGPFPPADRPVRKTILPFPCAILYNKASAQSRAGGLTGRTGRPQGSGYARFGELKWQITFQELTPRSIRGRSTS